MPSHILTQVMEERTGDLQRQLLLAQSELKAFKEDAQIQELDKAHLHTQLAGELECGLWHCISSQYRFYAVLQ